MDVLGWLGGWIWWGLTTAIGWLLAIIWFLIGGWVVTLAQIGVVVLILFGYKYGWQAAPGALVDWVRRFTQWVWAWARKREVPPREAPQPRPKAVARVVARRGGRRQKGDINISTLLNAAMIGSLVLWGLNV
jgi:hypothetical protein